MRTAALALLALLAASPARADGVDWHSSPRENLERLDVEIIGGARETVDMLAYVLTDHAIIAALRAAAARGVAVRLVLDGGQFAPRNDAAALLGLARAANVAIRVRPGDRADFMHMKAYAVDARVLRTGSANFSGSGEKRQDNDAVVIESAETLRRFDRTFEAIWDKSRAIEGE